MKDEALKLALEALENELAVDMTNLDEVDKSAQQMLEAIWAIRQALAAPVQERNFCERCGKRLGSGIHTCTPPAPVQEPMANASAWFALVMNAAAELEDASYCLRDEDAKRMAISGAKHYRDAAKALYTTPPSAPVQEPVAWINAEKRTFEWNGPVLWNTPTVAILDKIPLYTTPPAAPVQEPDDELTQALIERDEYHAIADELAEMIAQITGEDIGEHTSANFPWRNALDAAENWLCHPPEAPVQEPVLQEIEQYRLQMAGISTAAIGYWKEGDGIHPDYDTPALRDVAKLYTQYDKLYKAQNVANGVIAGALFDFMGWLTSRPKRIILSSADEASPAVDAIKEFAKMRGLSLDDAKVQDWQDNTTPPAQRQWTGLTDEEIDKTPCELYAPDQGGMTLEEGLQFYARAIEAKLKKKNAP
jgi:hypothetical protein